MTTRNGRLWVLVVINALLLLHTSSFATAPRDWKPRIDPQTRKILNLPFVVITRRAILTKYFGCPIAMSGPTAPVSQTGGFTCRNVYEITLSVGSDDAVTVAGDPVHVDQGDCISWHLISTDGSPANIDKIDFINSSSETEAARKGVTPQNIGDYCQGAVERCVMYISIPNGTYPYNVVVMHHNRRKRADPDVDVACSGPNCDEL